MLEAEQIKEQKRQENAKKAKKKIQDYQNKIKEEAEQIKVSFESFNPCYYYIYLTSLYYFSFFQMWLY